MSTKQLEAVVPATSLPRNGMVTVTLPASNLEKFSAFMHSDMWDRAQAARDAELPKLTDSLTALLSCARQHMGTSGGRVCATLLASLYNGTRVKFDASDLRVLDPDLFEHALNTMRLCYQTNREPHEFFENGGSVFEGLIADWGLEKKRRARS